MEGFIMTQSKIRVRFAPSPTGYVHIGNARTALFNWLFARSQGGHLILRIEDTDKERSRLEYEQILIKALSWLGIDWDEGINLEGKSFGNFGPYRQSERTHVYEQAIENLLKKNAIYPCFCSQEELDQIRHEQSESEQHLVYNGKCRHLSADEKNQQIKSGKYFVYRFRTPSKKIIIPDLIRGNVEIDLNLIGDFVITRPDSSPTFHLAVSVDDGMMQVSHVIRGEDHLPNTPKHILIMEALEFTIPQYAHLPMILGPDRQKLSKRHGETSLDEFRKAGYLPQALFNSLSLLGWSPKDNREFLKPNEILELFLINNVHKAAAIFDYDKFRWLAAQHISQLNDQEFMNWCGNYLFEKFPMLNDWKEDQLLILIKLIRDGVASFPDLVGRAQFLFEPDPDLNSKIGETLKSFASTVPVLEKLLNILENNWKQISFQYDWIKQVAKETGFKGKDVFMPIRLATSGLEHGPDLVGVLTLLGANKVISRLKNTISYLKSLGVAN